MEKKIKISEAEIEVMSILWKSKNAMTSTELRKILKEEKGWEKSTVLTLITRLVKKNAIHCEKKEVFYYTPNILEEEYKENSTRNIIDKLYDGSIKNFVVSLCDKNKLSKNDIEELRDYFNGGMENDTHK